MTAKPEPCPACGSADVVPIRYGMPTRETEAAARRGELELGGCMIGRPGGDPAWRCGVCRHEFGVIPRWNDERERLMADDWDNFEEKIDAAICELMLNDTWREHGAPTLTMVLRSMLKHNAPPPIKQEAAKLLELLETPLAKMDDGQRGDLSDELVGLLRFVCHRGRDDV